MKAYDNTKPYRYKPKSDNVQYKKWNILFCWLFLLESLLEALLHTYSKTNLP